MSQVLLDILRLAAGVAMLYFGAEWLVKGAAGLARAAYRAGRRGRDRRGLRHLGAGADGERRRRDRGQDRTRPFHVVGSNIANLGLILGLTALIARPRVVPGLIRRELPALIASTALPVLFLRDGVLGRIEGLVLVVGSVVFTVWMLRAVHAGGAASPPVSGPRAIDATRRHRIELGGLALLGLATLMGGGKVFVDGAVGIARAGGMSERVVGLTIVAVCTSLPELAASVVAAARGHADLAVGNVVGSNIFNMLLILGITALVRPVEGSLQVLRLDLLVLGALTLGTVMTLRMERVMRRCEGAVLLMGYVGFLVALARG